MNILQTQNCPECRSSLVDDMQNGELICSGCGIVVDDQIADCGPETISSNLEDKMKLEEQQDKQPILNMIWG